MALYLGVDGGGSKTLAVLADDTGNVKGVGLGGVGNFQGPGVDVARAQVKASIERALDDAGASSTDVSAAYFGMAGADRPQDFSIVRTLLEPIVPTSHWMFENDTTIGLWAGSGNGVGVGVVCGTGTNVVGFNRAGERIQVGGMGTLFGDYAGGAFLGELAFSRAMRGHEGRGIPTALYAKLCEHYQVDALLDLIDLIYEGKSLSLSKLVPLVFRTAQEGDLVAKRILVDVGTEMGISARAAMEKLFAKNEEIPVVAMGSVFQKAEYPLMFDTFANEIRRTHPMAKPRVLQCEPVFGAIYGALAQRGISPSEQYKANLESSFPGRP